MTQELQEYLTDQLDSASTPEQIDRAMVGAMKALIDCQRKTAERVKEMVIERDREKQRREGAKWMVGTLTTILSTGGAGAVLAVLKWLNVIEF